MDTHTEHETLVADMALARKMLSNASRNRIYKWIEEGRLDKVSEPGEGVLITIESIRRFANAR